MPDELPQAMQQAMSRILDAEARSERRPTLASREERIAILRAARAAVRQWREGLLTTDEALAWLAALGSRFSEASETSETG